MAAAATAAFHQLTVEVETATPGTYALICGMVDYQVSRKANLDSTEIPDCADESLPMYTAKSVRSLDYMVSGTGVWAVTSHEMMLQWIRTGASKNVRIGYSIAATGDVKYEIGAGILSQLDHARTKGQLVSASIQIDFSGALTTTDAS